MLTLNDGSAPRAVVVDLLDVPEVDVAVEDAVAAFGAVAVIEGQSDDVLHVLGVLEGFDGGVEVVLIRQVDALQDGALGVQQVAVVVAAADAVLGQHPVGAGARPPPAAAEQTQLLAAAVVLSADVGACMDGALRALLRGSSAPQSPPPHPSRARSHSAPRTLLPRAVEDFDVFELHADARPQGHRLGRVVFAAPLNGAVCMSPAMGSGHGAARPQPGLRL